MSSSFSVVIPTAGRPSYLERCLAALVRLAPPRDGFEVVVVNDGGGVATERVVSDAAASLDARTVRSAGRGPSAARNAGAAAARGRFLAFTDDDCAPRRAWLTGLERVLDGDPNAAAGGRIVNGAPDDIGAAATQVVVDALHAQFNRDPSTPRFIASSSLALSREGFDAVGGFDERFRYAEDREFCERWVSDGRRFTVAHDAVVEHLRSLPLREFWRQHYGYGRGAEAYARSRGRSHGGVDTVGVLRGLVRETCAARGGDRLRLPVYVALSQLATVTGYLREASEPRGADRTPRAPARRAQLMVTTPMRPSPTAVPARGWEEIRRQAPRI